MKRAKENFILQNQLVLNTPLIIFFVLQGNRFGANESSKGECISCTGIGHEVSLPKNKNIV